MKFIYKRLSCLIFGFADVDVAAEARIRFVRFDRQLVHPDPSQSKKKEFSVFNVNFFVFRYMSFMK
jgi:hypothetical protein